MKKNKMSYFCVIAAAAMLGISSGAAAEEESPSLDITALEGSWVYIDEAEEYVKGELALNDDGTTSMIEVHPCYALKGVSYCSNPEDASVQVMDIYVPEEYVNAVDNGDGTFTCTVNPEGTFTRGDVSYTGANAPIIYQNTIDGYREGYLFKLGESRKGGPGQFADYVNSGYVTVSIGTRGTDSETDGTAPAGIVDLKAGVRFLKANDEALPGDSGKIFAIGGSAGGSMAALLAASGNSELYASYLEEIGAADAEDDVYGAIVYCPIADLEMSDAAFEFLHSGELSSVTGWGEDAEIVEFDEFKTALHENLIASYEEYLETLGLNVEEYRTAFYEEINSCIADYVERYVEDIDAFGEENPGLVREGDSFTAESTETFVSTYMTRKKTVPGFDTLEKDSNETSLFGGLHFSENLAAIFEEMSSDYEEAEKYAQEYSADLSDEQKATVKLMSCIQFMTGEEESTLAKYWRFQNGTLDGDLGSVAAFTMNELLEKNGYNTEFSLLWGQGHGAVEYEYEDMQTYIDETAQLN